VLGTGLDSSDGEKYKIFALVELVFYWGWKDTYTHIHRERDK
jgi:hypothetical protein